MDHTTQRHLSKRVDYQVIVTGDYMSWDQFDNIAGHYFSPENRRFFGSKRYEAPIWSESEQGFVFVTSEQFVTYHPRYRSEPRAYTVRKIDLNGSIDEVGSFQQYKTLNQARKAVKALINGK